MIYRNMALVGAVIDTIKGCKLRLRASVILVSVFAVFPWLGVAAGDGRPEKVVGMEDYPLWHKMVMPSEEPRARPSMNVSGNGEWLAYQIKNNSNPGGDEIRVKHIESGQEHLVPATVPGYFASNGERYVYAGTNGSINTLHLKTGRSGSVASGKSFELVGDAYVAVMNIREEGDDLPGGTLSIVDLMTGGVREVDGVSSYRVHSESHQIAYVVRRNGVEGLEIIDARSSGAAKVVSCGRDVKFSALTWDGTGRSLAFIHGAGDGRPQSIGLYSADGHGTSTKVMNAKALAGVADGYRVSDGRLLVSQDRKFVLFDVQPDKEKNATSTGQVASRALVHVLNARDRFPPDLTYPTQGSGRRVVAWWPEQDQVVAISTEGERIAALTGDHRFAVLFSASKSILPDGHELDYPGFAADIYLVDVKSGNRKLVLERQETGGKFFVSPAGRYLSYFRDDNWWIYDVSKEKHANVSGKIGHPVVASRFEAEVSSWRGSPYGNPAWIGDDAKMVFSDKYDIWQASPDGEDVTRITDGREKGVVYRVHMPLHGVLEDKNSRYPGGIYESILYRGAKLELDNGIVLSMFGERTKQSGYSIWTSGTDVSRILYVDAHTDFIQPLSGGRKYVYREQRFDLSPQLVIHDMAGDETSVVVRSNPQQKNYKWGRAELVGYETSAGVSLQGVLYYPADYRVGNKYPMIVDIYEKQSDHLHHYINPSEAAYNYTTNFTSEGYFVFRPDISYEANNPGLSATDCVVSAVNEVLSKEIVDPNKIGLMGHSFGGYQAAFIITQTGLFSAAVAGAPVTDMVSSYLNMPLGKSSIFRFEAQQFRMTKPFHEDPEAYIRNSTIFNATGIRTPLLSWAGEDDVIIPSHESFRLYSLLRRMGKEHVLLVYPGELHHPMLSKDAGPDLYGRIKAWFGYYLKGDPPEEWILPVATPSARRAVH